MHRLRRGQHSAKEARAGYRGRSLSRGGKSAGVSAGLHQHQTSVSHCRKSLAQSGGRRSALVAREILLGRSDADEDRDHHSRNPAGRGMTEAAGVPAAAPSKQSRTSYRGYLYIAAAAFSWGVCASLGRAAFTGRLLPGSGIQEISPLILAQCRTTFSFLAIALVLIPRRGWAKLRLPWADFAKIFVLGTAGVAASNYFYYLAIQRTNVATAIIVQYTAPVWVLLYMVGRGRERPTTAKLTSVFLALIGIALVIGLFGKGKLQLDGLGVIAALIAAFSFAYYNVGAHSILERYDRWIVLLYTTLAAAAFWLVVNPPNRIAAAHYSSA